MGRKEQGKRGKAKRPRPPVRGGVSPKKKKFNCSARVEGWENKGGEEASEKGLKGCLSMAGLEAGQQAVQTRRPPENASGWNGSVVAGKNEKKRRTRKKIWGGGRSKRKHAEIPWESEGMQHRDAR